MPAKLRDDDVINLFIKELHGRGKTIRIIARRINKKYKFVWKRMKSLGLTPNTDRQAFLERMKVVASKGHQRRYGEYMAANHRMDGALEGWFGAGSKRQAEICQYLQEHGPLTARQLVQALGYKPMTSLNGGNSSLYKLLTKLKRAGLVEKCGADGKHGILYRAVRKTENRRI